MSFFDRLSDKLGAFFSRGPVFAFWLLGTAVWLWSFRYLSVGWAKSDFADRANFHQLWWLSVINIFTLFYCIWISNNQIRGNRANDEKFNLLADALIKQSDALATLLDKNAATELDSAMRELEEAIGLEKQVST